MTTTITEPTVPLPIAWQVPVVCAPGGEPVVAVRDVVAAAAAGLAGAPDALRAAFLDDVDGPWHGQPDVEALADAAVRALDDLLDAIDDRWPAPDTTDGLF